MEQPLGLWLPELRPFQLAQWDAFLDTSSNQLVLSTPDESLPFLVATPLDQRVTHFILCDPEDVLTPLHQVATLPRGTIPVELIPQGPLTRVENLGPLVQPQPLAPLEPSTSFEDCCLRSQNSSTTLANLTPPSLSKRAWNKVFLCVFAPMAGLQNMLAPLDGSSPRKTSLFGMAPARPSGGTLTHEFAPFQGRWFGALTQFVLAARFGN
jgi:hypothetical protein